MTKLHVSPDLALPEDAVTSTLVVYGGKGMGKTNFGSVLVEELTKAHLRSLGFIEYPSAGHARATDVLFLEGGR